MALIKKEKIESFRKRIVVARKPFCAQFFLDRVFNVVFTSRKRIEQVHEGRRDGIRVS